MIYVLTGESACGKSHIFDALDPAKWAKIDCDKIEHADRNQLVEQVAGAGKPVIISITRGVSTLIKRSPGLQFKVLLIDASVETILENRRLKALARGKEYTKDPAEVALKIKSRLKRLEAVYKKYGVDNERGSQAVISARLAELEQVGI